MELLLAAPKLLSRALYDVGKPGAVVGILLFVLLSLLLVPLPTPLLDILIVLNLVFSILLILIGLFTSEPLRLSAFPTLLLLVTLYRLALNVSSTRLILLNGDKGLDAAGTVIQSFGSFVVQGDFVVGAIIFAMIAIVNFVVIAKGAARVAEVAARFTLDALPGKQLAIDADVRTGSISKEEAQQRRSVLAEESQFYGAMDGAMRFVQGDAIAGFIIVFINLVGGISLGVSRGLDLSAAINQFGVLTIGDGLVNVLPSLLISACSGVVVSRVAKPGRDSAARGPAETILAELVSEPRAFAVSALLLLSLSLIPGFPFVPFFIVGVAFLGATVILASRKERYAESNDGLPRLSSSELKVLPGGGLTLRALSTGTARLIDRVRPLALEFDAVRLGPLLQNQSELERFREFENKLRETTFRERGILLPEIEIAINNRLDEGAYVVLVREQPHRHGSVRLGESFVSGNVASLQAFGIETKQGVKHPVTQRSAHWVDSRFVQDGSLERLGVEVLAPSEFLVLEAVGAAFTAVEEWVGIQEIRDRLARLREEHPALVEEVFSAPAFTQLDLVDLVRRLVRERVSVRDMKRILEAVVEFRAMRPGTEEKLEWLDELHGYVRRVLSRQIVVDIVGSGGALRTFMLADEVEEEFRSASGVWDRSRGQPPLSPEVDAALKRSAQTLFAPVLERGAVPVVIVCSGDIRPAVEEFLCQQPSGREWFRTLAYEELGSQYRFEAVGILGLS